MEASIPKAVDIALRIIEENPDIKQKVVTDMVHTVIIKEGKK